MSLALLVDSSVEVFPNTLDLDVDIIHSPAAADGTLVFAGHLLNVRQKSDRPSIDR